MNLFFCNILVFFILCDLVVNIKEVNIVMYIKCIGFCDVV